MNRSLPAKRPREDQTQNSPKIRLDQRNDRGGGIDKPTAARALRIQ